jgi:hypothetical protein
MATDIATYLKYANLQMAAESLFGLLPSALPGVTSTSMNVRSLTKGNDRTSVFTEAQAKQFLEVDKWTVLQHKSNTGTGFSGTLFQNSVTGEIVLSFRSTEFVDDSARDNKATNEMEIKEKGWAFGQIADMEKWYAELNASPTMLQGKSFAVTGYSLGGHLATAFNLLRSEQGQAARITSTYTFNGAGVGEITGSSAVGLSYVMQKFQTMLAGNADAFVQEKKGSDSI